MKYSNNQRKEQYKAYGHKHDTLVKILVPRHSHDNMADAYYVIVRIIVDYHINTEHPYLTSHQIDILIDYSIIYPHLTNLIRRD